MPSRAPILVVVVVAVVLAIGLGGPGAQVGDEPGGSTATYPATVTFQDEADGTRLGTVQSRVADSPDERYQGLSNTDPLPADSGMLFVYSAEANRTFVMRQMNYPIDMVFIDANGTVTTIHHAETEAQDDPGDDLTPYPGRGKWVLEVPYEWTAEHGVQVGDEVTISYSGGE